ncbi:helix-turn-helix domain-containing protein [Falsiroseomonas sp. HC035]|uniref:helix-turn-helix domain-containing protein n=1 Tax=Falsiroseomonas sp. HC035 TaxID=3390999 RepID=UPI003D323A48
MALPPSARQTRRRDPGSGKRAAVRSRVATTAGRSGLPGSRRSLAPRKRPVQAVLRDRRRDPGAGIQVLLAGGYARFTTTRVAERAGVSIGTLYQYFPNKRALLAALLAAHLDRIGDAVAAAGAAGCRTPAEAYAPDGPGLPAPAGRDLPSRAVDRGTAGRHADGRRNPPWLPLARLLIRGSTAGASAPHQASRIRWPLQLF